MSDIKTVKSIFLFMVFINFALIVSVVLIHFQKNCEMKLIGKANNTESNARVYSLKDNASEQGSEWFQKAGRIIGGKVTMLSKYPYVAAVVIIKHDPFYDDDTFKCGACIISRAWLISAAHCLATLDQYSIELIRIRTDSSDWRLGIEHTVRKLLKHLNYRVYENDYDLGLIKVFEAMSKRNIIRVAPSTYKYVTNSTACIAGWGYFKFQKIISNKLRSGEVTLFSQEYCIQRYAIEDNQQTRDSLNDPDYVDETLYLYGDYFDYDTLEYRSGVTRRMICAGTTTGDKDGCYYDSGGPLVQNNMLIGLISWGRECGSKIWPGVYVRLSYFHNWISNVLADDP